MERTLAQSPARKITRRVEAGLIWARAQVFWIIGLGAAYLLGQQIVRPDRRGIKGLAGLSLVTLLLLAPPAFGLSFFIIMFPFPAYTSFGSTNTMIVFFIAIFWLARLGIQLALFDAKPLLTSIVLKVGYHGLTAVFTYFAIVYGMAALAPSTIGGAP